MDKQKIVSDYMSELGKKGGETNKRKGNNYFKEISQSRFKGMTSEEKSEYMRKVRNGQSPIK